MLLPDKGSGEEGEKVEQVDEGDPLPGTARHREFYPEGVATILRVSALNVNFSRNYFLQMNKFSFCTIPNKLRKLICEIHK